MPEDVTPIIAEVREVSDEADRLFGQLTSAQLNWKPAPDSWSVAQCLEHLIAMNADFFPAFDAITRGLDYVPDDLANLERDMSDTYFVNFSLFQSVPDSWAIHQLFPVMPLHRHLEEPTRHATLADITCDSDGKIERFIDLRDVKKTLELHPLRQGEPYYLGIFLVGAYQEILGDMHNLFGDTNVVHVDFDAQGRPKLPHVVRGDRVQDVLTYVEYFETDLLASLRRHLETALEDGRISYEESASIYGRYEAGLHGYTYLKREHTPAEIPSFAKEER
jgi:arginine decarboxylase